MRTKKQIATKHDSSWVWGGFMEERASLSAFKEYPEWHLADAIEYARTQGYWPVEVNTNDSGQLILLGEHDIHLSPRDIQERILVEIRRTQELFRIIPMENRKTAWKFFDVQHEKIKEAMSEIAHPKSVSEIWALITGHYLDAEYSTYEWGSQYFYEHPEDLSYTYDKIYQELGNDVFSLLECPDFLLKVDEDFGDVSYPGGAEPTNAGEYATERIEDMIVPEFR